MENKKYILITGASSGLGEHIAVKLSAHYKIILNGRNRTTLSAVQQKCVESGMHLQWVYDLNDMDSLEESLKNFIAENHNPGEIFQHRNKRRQFFFRVDGSRRIRRRVQN